MAKALIAIGISSAGGLDQLDGAVTDAEALAEWANDSRYDHVKLFVDRNGASVCAQDIFDFCSALVAKPDLENLVIYFSGHGYAIPGHEVWLLPKWNENANEAINVSASMLIARRYEKPSISFIADACRVAWNVPDGVTGMVILPRSPKPSSASRVDEFFATRFGDPSQQYQESALRAAFGIFSKQLVKALGGEAAIDRDNRHVVTSRSLGDYLTESVPRACAAVPGAVVQNPGTNAQWIRPRDVYAEFQLGRSPFKSLVTKDGVTAPTAGPSPAPQVEAAKKALDQEIANDVSRYIAAEGRMSFETQTGATVIGAKIDDALITRGRAEIYDGTPQHVCAIAEGAPVGNYMRPDKPATLLLRLAEHQKWARCRIAIPIFPGFVATALIDDNGFSSLNYRRAGFFSSGRDPMETALAEVAAMFRQGMLIDRQRLNAIIDDFRDRKAENPALAVIAAHICYRIGDLKQIADMENWPIGGGAYTPYDFQLLTARVRPAPSRTQAGDLPIMSPAWGLLPAAEFDVDDHVKAAAGGVVPSLWTMVNATAGEKLAEYFQTAFAPAPPPNVAA